MFRVFCIATTIVFSSSAFAQTNDWLMGEPAMIYELGTRPSLFEGTIAFLDGNGGPVMYYDGTEFHLIFEPVLRCWEPVNANGSVAWRDNPGGASTSEIYRWDGDAVENVSNAPGIIDCDLAAAGNGDLIWSQNHTWLWYYDASVGTAASLGVSGVHPALHVTDEGVATYAYQDPDTDEVRFFDGSETHLLGAGSSTGAFPAVWDGAVAWVGQSEVGGDFTKSEIYYWEDGQTQRLTNDDDAGGISDEYPTLWRNALIWSRSIDSVFSPKLFIWDGHLTDQLTFTTGKYASVHHGQLAWTGDDGLYLADLFRNGDLDGDHDVDLADLAQLLGNYGETSGMNYSDGDLDGDADVDLADLAGLLGQYGYTL